MFVLVKRGQPATISNAMLTEKEMEDAIAKDPERYLGESGLRLVSRQYRIGSYIFDLLFEDRHAGRLIVELQRGTLDRVHTYKILDYYDEYKSKHPREFVDLMVVANQIPAERKQRLRDKGIAFHEISMSEFPEPQTLQPVPPPIDQAAITETPHVMESPSTITDTPPRIGSHTDFWRGLLDLANKQTRLFEGVGPTKKPWLGRQTVKGSLVFAVLKEESWIELCIQKSPQESEDIMRQFELAKADIEGRFGEPLIWDRKTGRNRCKIMSKRIPIGLHQKEQWEALQSTLVNRMIKFASALGLQSS